MSLDLTVVGGPIFGSRSRVNTESRDFGTFTVSSMQAILRRIVDGDPFSFWQSATGDDTNDEIIDITFQDKSNKIIKAIDFIVLQNFNGRLFKIEQKAGGGSLAVIPEFDFSVTPYTGGPDLILEISELSPDTLRLTISTTQTANDFKKLGGFYASKSVFQLTQGSVKKYDERFRERVREVVLGDNSRSREYNRRSATSYEHWGAQKEFQYASEAERDFMRQIKRGGEVFTYVPEAFDVPRNVFTTNFKGAWRSKYQADNKGAGYSIPFGLEESGPL